jgi:hypothetical protein
MIQPIFCAKKKNLKSNKNLCSSPERSEELKQKKNSLGDQKSKFYTKPCLKKKVTENQMKLKKKR